MKLKISPIISKGEWEAFITQCEPNTFLHSWHWGEFHEKMKYKIFRIGIYSEETKLYAVAFIIKIKAKRGSFLFCPHGPIFMNHELGIMIQVFELLIQYLKDIAKEEKCSFIRISPLLEDSEENRKIFYELEFRDAPVHLMHPERALMIDITKTNDEILKGMRKTTRYSIKKAQKEGVQILKSSQSNDIKKFWDIYSATFQRQNFAPFSQEYLRTEFEIFQKDNQAIFFFAQYKGETISAALVIFSKHSSFYHHGASFKKYSNIPASHLLQWEIIQEAKKRGCRLHNFWGIAPDNNKNHPWYGLSLFKTGFGGFANQYVHAKDYVISSKYWIAYSIEKIRRIKRGL